MGKIGRPKGSKNGERKTVVEIKKWTPEHQRIVDLYISTKHTNKEIAEIVDCTPHWVGMVLGSRQGKRLIQEHMDRMKELMQNNIEARMLGLAEKSIGKLEETIDADFVLGTDAKKHQDNVALSLTKGYIPGRTSDAGEGERALTHGLAKELVSALKKANDAEERLKEREEADEENEILIT